MTYYFNTRTGESVYKMPPELAAAAAAGGGTAQSSTASAASAAFAPASAPPIAPPAAPLAAPPAAPPAAAADPLDPRSYDNASVLAAGDSVPHYRDAAEAVLRALAAGGALGVHRFPPTESRTLRFVVVELAEDYGLRCCMNAVGAGAPADAPRHVVAWREGCDPPEVEAMLAEEAALTAEAERRRQGELAAARAAVLERKARLAGGGGAQATAAAAGALVLVGGVAVAPRADVVEVVPLFARKDKRSISAIQDDLKGATKRKREEGGGEGSV
jgi:hypothetical protein